MAYVSVFSIQRGNLKLLAIAAPHQLRCAQQLPPGGSQGEETISNSQPMHHVVSEATGRQIGDPYGWRGNRMRRLCRRRVAKLATPTGGAAIECGGETVSGRYIMVSQKAKPFFAFWDACHATTMALHLVGDVPRLRSPSRGEIIGNN